MGRRGRDAEGCVRCAVLRDHQPSTGTDFFEAHAQRRHSRDRLHALRDLTARRGRRARDRVAWPNPAPQSIRLAFVE